MAYGGRAQLEHDVDVVLGVEERVEADDEACGSEYFN